MKRIILYGDLAKRWGREHSFDVSTVAEAIRALKANFKDFESYMCSAHVYGIGFKVFCGEQSLYIDELKNPIRETDEIKIVPVIFGSGADLRIILGIALLTVGLIFAPGATGLLFGVTQGLITGGVGLIISGVAQMLTPVQAPQDSTSKSSYIFAGPVNKGNQGDGIPIGYGRMFIGSAVVSAEVTTSDQSS
jgi:predicted phage tail protein